MDNILMLAAVALILLGMVGILLGIALREEEETKL